MKARRCKLCLISSSGGHYEQLRMLKPLEGKFNVFWVTERSDYASPADYYLRQTGLNNRLVLPHMLGNAWCSLKIWMKEKPDVVITTGTMVALPMCLIARILCKKVIYIETFARVYDATRAGKFMYKFADLFIYQWKGLKDIYPKGVYGGSIY